MDRMAKGSATRDAIIGEALSQAVRIGLEGITVGGLASSMNLSKSGLFAHFKSKEALQLAVVEEAIARFGRSVVEPALKTNSPGARLDRLFLGYLDWIRGNKQADGCLFITAIQEFDDQPGAIRDRLSNRNRAGGASWRALHGKQSKRVRCLQRMTSICLFSSSWVLRLRTNMRASCSRIDVPGQP